jgi:hypothetical protein
VTTPVFYAPLQAVGENLVVEPALASWDKAGSPGQVRSADFIAGVHTIIGEQVSTTPDPLALRLDVGLPGSVSLLNFHDLDNYLFPLVPKLTVHTGRQFASVWATKRHAPTSSVRVDQAQVTTDPGGTYSSEVTTTAAADSTTFKEQIRDQITAAHPTSGRPRSTPSAPSSAATPEPDSGTLATAHADAVRRNGIGHDLRPRMGRR